MLDVETFRASYPEFADVTRYTVPAINRQITFAKKMMNEERWGDLLNDGMCLFVAHYLTLASRAVRLEPNGHGGEVKGFLTSKSVDKVSGSYDGSAILQEGAGHWNQTTYGIQYWQLMQMVGAGGIQI